MARLALRSGKVHGWCCSPTVTRLKYDMIVNIKSTLTIPGICVQLAFIGV